MWVMSKIYVSRIIPRFLVVILLIEIEKMGKSNFRKWYYVFSRTSVWES